MPFGLQPIHLLVIAIVALLLFGPNRLPEIGRGIGKAWTEFRKGTREMTEGFRDEVSKPINETEQKIFPAPPASQPFSPPVAPAQPVQPVTFPTNGQTDSSGIFCNQCGTRNPTGSRFCSSCGSRIDA